MKNLTFLLTLLGVICVIFLTKIVYVIGVKAFMLYCIPGISIGCYIFLALYVARQASQGTKDAKNALQMSLKLERDRLSLLEKSDLVFRATRGGFNKLFLVFYNNHQTISVHINDATNISFTNNTKVSALQARFYEIQIPNQDVVIKVEEFQHKLRIPYQSVYDSIRHGSLITWNAKSFTYESS